MNVLLIQPPVRDFYQTRIRTQPLGLACLAAFLQRHGHVVTILDCQPPGLKKQIPLPDAFLHLRQFYETGDISPFRLYQRYYHFGLSPAAIADHINNCRPDVVGIACQYTPYTDETRAVAALVKAVNGQTPVVVGGAHASALPETLLRSPHIDYVVLGEGEQTLAELLACIQAGEPPVEVDGIGFKNGATLRINPRTQFIGDLDQLPFPARELLDPSWYTIQGRPYTMLVTSRGCPRSCSYCSVRTVMGQAFRARSPENILAEIKQCRDSYGISVFDIEDDNFTFDPKRAATILELMIEVFGENELMLYGMNGLSLITLNKKMLRTMQRAGFRKFDLALGSSTAGESKSMQRPFNAQKAEKVFEHIAQLRIPVTTYVILGFPGQRLQEMVDTLLYLAERATYIGPSIFYPSPGTPVYAQLAGGAPAHDFSLLRSSAFPVTTREFSRLELVTLLRLARWINFIKRTLERTGMPAMPLADLPPDEGPGGRADAGRNTAAAPPDNPCTLFSALPIGADEAGKLLTTLLLREHRFYGMRRIGKRTDHGYRYQIFPYATAATVMRLFFTAQGNRVIAPAVSPD
jgi:tRNA A37 methylthiotransferase MiaB